MSEYFKKEKTKFVKNEKKKEGYAERVISIGCSGTVKFYDEEKGYGFLRTGNTQDVFFHVTQLPPGLPEIPEGMAFTFDVAETRKGMQAVNMVVCQ